MSFFSTPNFIYLLSCRLWSYNVKKPQMNPMLHYNLPWCCLESRLVSEFVSDCLDNNLCFDSHLTSDSSMSMETTALLQMAAPIIVLNLLLPSVDTVTDLITIIKLYLGGHGCIDENVFSIHDQLAVCERNPAEYCSTNQSALCTVSEDDGTYTCSRARRDHLWQQCIADPRGFCEDPDTRDVFTFCHGVLRHPKFATMLLGI